MENILTAHYENGRFGSNKATVNLRDGRYTFCNGYSDPWAARDLNHAEDMFYEFLADKVPAFQPQSWMGKGADGILRGELRMKDGLGG